MDYGLRNITSLYLLTAICHDLPLFTPTLPPALSSSVTSTSSLWSKYKLCTHVLNHNLFFLLWDFASTKSNSLIYLPFYPSVYKYTIVSTIFKINKQNTSTKFLPFFCISLLLCHSTSSLSSTNQLLKRVFCSHLSFILSSPHCYQVFPLHHLPNSRLVMAKSQYFTCDI